MTPPRTRAADPRERPTRRARGDAGSTTSLAVALLTPLFVLLAFAGLQAALWSHARTEARVIARDTAALVARSGVGAGDAQASATAVLQQDTDLTSVRVSVTVDQELVRVVVSGKAPGILRGTRRDVEVVEAMPREESLP